MQVASVALGYVIGLAMGLLGGGSILTVPIFVYLLGFGAKESIAMSLAVVGVTSLVGAIGHWRDGHVNARVAVVFGVVAMAGTFIGTRLATRLTGDEQLAIFATVMLLAAGFMLRRRGIESVGTPAGGASATTRRGSLPLAGGQGLVVGVLTGLVGVGGGFLIVPALVCGGLAMCDAVGTSLLVITMNCAIGFYGHAGEVEIAWPAVALLTAGTLPGIATGTYAMHLVSQDTLQRGFAALLALLAMFMLYQLCPPDAPAVSEAHARYSN